MRTDSRGIAELQAAGLDVSEHVGAGGIDVVLHGARDEATLRATGMSFDVKVRDVEAHDRAQRRADQAWAQARDESALPSGNTAYRRLPDFEAALKALAVRVPGAREADHAVAPVVRRPRHRRHRDHARPARAGRQADLPEHGTHHAREWPSAEHPLEFAYDLLRNYGKDERATQLVEARRGRSSSRS